MKVQNGLGKEQLKSRATVSVGWYQQ